MWRKHTIYRRWCSLEFLSKTNRRNCWHIYWSWRQTNETIETQSVNVPWAWEVYSKSQVAFAFAFVSVLSVLTLLKELVKNVSLGLSTLTLVWSRRDSLFDFSSFPCFAGNLCALPADNGPCLSEIQDALSPSKKTGLTQACANYLSDLQNSCSIQTTSSNFEECGKICGK